MINDDSIFEFGNMNTYRFLVNFLPGTTIFLDLIKGHVIEQQRCLIIRKWHEYGYIERYSRTTWTDITNDIVFVHLFQSIHRENESLLSLIDRGDRITPMYRLVFRYRQLPAIIRSINDFKWTFEMNSMWKTWLIELITNRDITAEHQFEFINDGMNDRYVLNVFDLTLNVKVTASSLFTTSIEFDYNVNGEMLRYFCGIDELANDVYWRLDHIYPESVRYIGKVSNIKIVINKALTEKRRMKIREIMNRISLRIPSIHQG